MPHLRVSEEVTALIEARIELGAAKEELGSYRIAGVMARHSKDAPKGEIEAVTKDGEIVGKIAAEFGEDSVERIQARKLLADEIGQLFFPGMEPAPKAEKTTPKTRVPLRHRKDLRDLAAEIEAHPEAEKIKKAVAGIAASNSLGVPLQAAIQTDLESEIKTRTRRRFTESEGAES